MALSEKVRSVLEDLLVDEIKSTEFGDGLEEQIIRHGATFEGVSTLTDAELVVECDNHGIYSNFIEERAAVRVRVGDHVETGVGWLEVTDIATGPDGVTLIATLPKSKLLGRCRQDWHCTMPKATLVNTLRLED